MQALGVFRGVCRLRGLFMVGAVGWLGAAPVGHVNPGEPDNCGQTPDSHAINHVHKEAVKTLCGREDIDPDKPDNCNKTPLSYAAISEHCHMRQLVNARNWPNCTIRVGRCQSQLAK